MLSYAERIALFERTGIKFDRRAAIRPGDMFLAARDTTPYLLTCYDICNGSVFSHESSHTYELHECVKVTET